MHTPTSDTINHHLAAMLDGHSVPAMRTPEFAHLVAALAHAVTDRGELERIGLDATRLMLARAEASIRAQREVALMIDRGNSLC